MQTILSLGGILILCIAGYYGAIYAVKLWTGCGREEAVKKIQNAFRGGYVYQLETDTALMTDISDNVRYIIGENRYNRLCEYNRTALDYPLLTFGMEGMLHYIAISVDYPTDLDEKKRIVNIIVHKVIKAYLANAGYRTFTYVVWRKRDDIRIPVLYVYYARNKEEEEILLNRIKRRRHLHQT